MTRATGFTTATSYGSGGNMVAMRGFTDNSVAFLYDGIRNAAELGNLGWPYDPWTVERIEVLNGPASVLYGIGGIGGSINIIPRRPNRSAEHTVSLSGGSFDTYKLALDSTGPLSERVLYRVDVSRQQSDGYINQGTSEGTVVSGSLTFLLSDTPSIRSPRTEAPDRRSDRRANALKPTRGRQLEVGVKPSTWGSRLEWTLAGYRIQKTDFSVGAILVITGLNGPCWRLTSRSSGACILTCRALTRTLCRPATKAFTSGSRSCRRLPPWWHLEHRNPT